MPVAGTDGEGGADWSVSAADAVLMRRVGGTSWRVGADMFNERFLVFRGRLPGDSGPFWPKKGLGGGTDDGGGGDCSGGGGAFERRPTAASGRDETGDSGDDPGDESVTDDESTVETVVVGDESVESVEADVDTLACP